MQKIQTDLHCEAFCPFRLKVELEFIRTIANSAACINLPKADTDYCCGGNDSGFMHKLFELG